MKDLKADIGFAVSFGEMCKKLADAGIADAKYEVGLLLRRFCGIGREELPTLQSDAVFDNTELLCAVEKRAARYPLQYIIGEWGFYNQTYEVSPACLIPREDTETLVTCAVRELPGNAFFADLCTGSGCIAISTLCERKDTHADAVDIFPETLALAKRNAERNGVSKKINFFKSDILRPDFALDGEYDAIISNPPYIPTSVVKTLEPELEYEPSSALDGGEDGLLFYRAILDACRERRLKLKSGGFILFEIGYDQAKDMEKIAGIYGYRAEIVKDLGGNDRVAKFYPMS